MRTVLTSVLLGLLTAPIARAGDAGISGNWKLTILEGNQAKTFWIVKFATSKGKAANQAVALTGVPPSQIEDLRVQGDLLSFTVILRNSIRFSFEGKLPQ